MKVSSLNNEGSVEMDNVQSARVYYDGNGDKDEVKDRPQLGYLLSGMGIWLPVPDIELMVEV